MKKLIVVICTLFFLTSCVEGYLIETRYSYIPTRPYSYTVISTTPYIHKGYIPIRVGRSTIYYKSIPNEPKDNVRYK